MVSPGDTATAADDLELVSPGDTATAADDAQGDKATAADDPEMMSPVSPGDTATASDDMELVSAGDTVSAAVDDPETASQGYMMTATDKKKIKKSMASADASEMNFTLIVSVSLVDVLGTALTSPSQ